jgi:hypothetical protein
MASGHLCRSASSNSCAHPATAALRPAQPLLPRSRLPRPIVGLVEDHVGTGLDGGDVRDGGDIVSMKWRRGRLAWSNRQEAAPHSAISNGQGPFVPWEIVRWLGLSIVTC